MTSIEEHSPSKSHHSPELWIHAMLNPVNAEPIEILLVEDNENDSFMTMEALREGKIRNTVHLVEDGITAVQFLRRQGQYADAPRPDLILLDWSLPGGLNGEDVLDEVRQDPNLRLIPVVVMTRSQRERDVLTAYKKRANCYVTKPVDVAQFLEAVHKIEDFWLTVVKLPRAA